MIKRFSIIAILALGFMGCGGSGDKTTGSAFVAKNTNAVTISGLKSLGDSIDTKASSRSLQSVAKQTYGDDTTPTSSQGTPCESGSMKITGGQNSQAFSLDAQQCKNGSTTINGALTAQIDEQTKSGSIEVTRDITITDSGENMFVAKGSKLSAKDNIIHADFKATINGNRLSAKNVAIAYTEQGEVTTVHFQSGQVNIADYYLEFVAQPTPFVIDESGLASGELDLKDGAGHNVVITVDANKQPVLKVDQNGDGTFSADEILTDDGTNNPFE